MIQVGPLVEFFPGFTPVNRFVHGPFGVSRPSTGRTQIDAIRIVGIAGQSIAEPKVVITAAAIKTVSLNRTV